MTENSVIAPVAASAAGLDLTLPAAPVREILERAFAEDAPGGDITSQLLIPAGARATAVLNARVPGVFSGATVFRDAMQLVDPGTEVELLLADGDRFDLVHAVHLDFEVGGVSQLGLGRPEQLRQPGGVPSGHHGQVVVLRQHCVGEAVPVVRTSPAPHSEPFQDPQAGGGLPGVGDPGPCPLGQLDKFGGRGGDRGHPLNEVQGDTFGQQD